jgi:membrane protease YdiL (CAAX protease family)
VLGAIALGATFFVSSVVSIFALVASGSFNPKEPAVDMESFLQVFDQMAAHFWGISVIVLPGQLTMLCATLAAAFLSPEKLRIRLGYVRGVARWWMLPLLLLGTIFTGIASGLAAEALFTEESASIRLFLAMARNPSQVEFIGALLLLSVIPAFVEESLFRGYIQRRLLQRWSPAAAIATSTAFFALAHFDLQHTLVVIPIGVWLGYLAWRTNALWPGMICHAAQNVSALLASRYSDPTAHGLTPELVPVLAVTGLGLVASVFFLQRTKIHRLTANDAPGH